jgi:hypothetical protein
MHGPSDARTTPGPRSVAGRDRPTRGPARSDGRLLGQEAWAFGCPQGQSAARGGLRRGELASLIEQELSIAQIAAEVQRSKATVRHWLGRYGLKTWSPSGSRRLVESRSAAEAGLRQAAITCATHGETQFVVDGRGYYRCRKCRAEAVSRRRRKVKETLVHEAGGACCICGYAQSMRALHFHHLDPSQKRLEINARGQALSVETLRAEARKCVLLCSNCHAEVEDGRAKVVLAGLTSERCCPG